MLEIYAHLKNSIGALEASLKTAIGNADNFNTPGYKYITTSFTTVYSSVLRTATSTRNPVQLGASMTVGSTSTDFSQGNLTLGAPLDAAIVGEGFFIVSKSPYEFSSGSPKAYERGGRFVVDYQNKFLTDTFGRKIFGYKVSPDGTADKSQLVPIETDGSADVGFIDGGMLVTNYAARKSAIDRGESGVPDSKPIYQLALTSFRNKQGLILGDGGSYVATIAAGQELPYSVSGEGGYGSIRGATLEASNIDVARVALDMNQLNRGFAAVQGVIDDVNRIIQNLQQALSS